MLPDVSSHRLAEHSTFQHLSLLPISWEEETNTDQPVSSDEDPRNAVLQMIVRSIVPVE